VKAFLVTLMVLSLGLAVRAQPQAPVVWEEARWAYLAGWPGSPLITTLQVIPMGDTLLFTAFNIGSAVSDTILICSSFDNGQTFTPWSGLTRGEESVIAQFTGSAGRFYCFLNRQDPSPLALWLRMSDNSVGFSDPEQYWQDAYVPCGFASGNEVLARYAGIVDGHFAAIVIRSTDRGQSWSAPTVIDTADFGHQYTHQAIAFTRTQRLILAEPAENQTDYRLRVARSDSSGQNWTTFQVLPGQTVDSVGARTGAIVGDTSSEVAGVLGAYSYRHDPLGPLRPLFFRTTNGGESWQMPACLTDGASGITSWITCSPLAVCRGKLWLVGWEHDDPQGWNYLATRFSANHGRNWYPLQVAADSLAQSMFFCGQIRGNRMDLYWVQGCCGQAQPWDYRTVSGAITPDTAFPQLSPLLAPPDTVRVGQQLEFSAMVTDNDTLAEVRLVIVELSGDTLRFEMPRTAVHPYYITWVVPESGYYSYWLEAEDFWENIATLPDTGMLHFVTEGWTAAEDFIPHPSSLRLSVYPIPFNSTTQIEFTLPSTQRVSLRLYDVLGREVAVVMNEIRTAGRHEMTFDASGLPSGVYLCRLEAGGMAQTRKIVLVK
jgi:hypothetical protein